MSYQDYAANICSYSAMDAYNTTTASLKTVRDGYAHELLEKIRKAVKSGHYSVNFHYENYHEVFEELRKYGYSVLINYDRENCIEDIIVSWSGEKPVKKKVTRAAKTKKG